MTEEIYDLETDEEWDEYISGLYTYAESMGLNPDHVIGAALGGVDY